MLSLCDQWSRRMSLICRIASLRLATPSSSSPSRLSGGVGGAGGKFWDGAVRLRPTPQSAAGDRDLSEQVIRNYRITMKAPDDRGIVPTHNFPREVAQCST